MKDFCKKSPNNSINILKINLTKGFNMVSPKSDAEEFLAEKQNKTRNYCDYNFKEQSPGAIWNNCLQIIKDNVNESVYNTWFAPISAVSLDNNTLTVSVPSQFFCEWIEAHYYDLLQTTLRKVIGNEIKLKYSIEGAQISCDNTVMQVPAFKYAPNAKPKVIKEIKSAGKLEMFNSKLNPAYTFESMIIGESNQLAVSASESVVEDLTKTRYNPFFIYGNTGLGKTHLASAIGNKINQKYPNLKVLYTNSENFSIDYVNAVKSDKVHEFKTYYQSIDVLIVDDIQFLASRSKTQDTFFHIYNALRQMGKQIIIASDKPPKDVKNIDERLISRFQWGLTVQIQPPDQQMRMEILKKKSENEGIELSNEVCDYIARNVTSSIRELEGTLITMLARHTFDSREINLELAREIIEGIANVQDRPLTVDIIKETVSEYYQLAVENMESTSRKHQIVLARQMAMYLIKELMHLPLKKIGSEFGGKDHTTVMHSCQTIENYLQLDKTVKASYEFIKNKLLNR